MAASPDKENQDRRARMRYHDGFDSSSQLNKTQENWPSAQGPSQLVVSGTNAGRFAPQRETVGSRREDLNALITSAINQGGPMALHGDAIKEMFDRYDNDKVLNSGFVPYLSKASTVGGVVGINDYGVKGRRQYAAERRRLLDLYYIVQNNGDLRTAVTHLRNEIFRRGLEWEPAFEFKCPVCDEEYTTREAKRLKYHCDCSEENQVEVMDKGEDGNGRKRPDHTPPTGPRMRKPDKKELEPYMYFTEHANYFGQSFESILREAEDDINVVDDAFLYLRKKYEISDLEIARAQEDPFDPTFEFDSTVVGLFRLDPTLVEFDTDDRGIPGQGHHVCVLHRETLLDVPSGEGWDLEWKGLCPVCGLRTYPIYYKYSEQLANSFSPGRPQNLYLTEDECIHWSRFSPSETFGFSPVLSIFEKAMTLIGMDRYLYDYFYERKVPQGVVTVVTDDTASFNATKAELEAKMQQDPHYIPWVAIASKSGQGKMDFVRFAYSLDELDYLPVRDEIRERISGLYGVSNVWMASTEGIGGLNNETVQLQVMSRVVEGAQRGYTTDVFPKLERALHIKDWHLKIKVPEESTELVDLQILQTKVSIAQGFVSMGFGAEWDSEAQEFHFSGRVLSMEEQQKKQMEMGFPTDPSAGGAANAPKAQGGMTATNPFNLPQAANKPENSNAPQNDLAPRKPVSAPGGSNKASLSLGSLRRSRY